VRAYHDRHRRICGEQMGQADQRCRPARLVFQTRRRRRRLVRPARQTLATILGTSASSSSAKELTTLAGAITYAGQPGMARSVTTPRRHGRTGRTSADNSRKKGLKMSMSTSLSRRSAGLQGEVIRPGQPRFDEARRAFNLAADQEPAAVVFAESVHDIVAAVTFAARHGQQI